MLIEELTSRASLEVLAGTHLGRLACARGMQLYIVPIDFSYQDYWLYNISMPRQEIEWMRANPLVCVEADQMRRAHWTTVVVFGRYEELRDTPEFRRKRALAFNLLRQRPLWWEHASAKPTPVDAPEAVPIYYRIKVEQVTGRRAVIEQAISDTTRAKSASGAQGWLRKAFFLARREKKPKK